MWQDLNEVQEAVESLFMNRIAWDRSGVKAIWEASGMAGGIGSSRRAK